MTVEKLRILLDETEARELRQGRSVVVSIPLDTVTGVNTRYGTIDGIRIKAASLNTKPEGRMLMLAVDPPEKLPTMTKFVNDLNNHHGYKLDHHGQPVCPICGTKTYGVYVVVPNLTCWSCGSRMGDKFTPGGASVIQEPPR